jgi:hypothetical protein
MHAMHAATMFARARVFAGLVYDSIAPEKFETIQTLEQYNMLSPPQSMMASRYPQAPRQETCWRHSYYSLWASLPQRMD